MVGLELNKPVFEINKMTLNNKNNLIDVVAGDYSAISTIDENITKESDNYEIISIDNLFIAAEFENDTIKEKLVSSLNKLKNDFYLKGTGVFQAYLSSKDDLPYGPITIQPITSSSSIKKLSLKKKTSSSHWFINDAQKTYILIDNTIDKQFEIQEKVYILKKNNFSIPFSFL